MRIATDKARRERSRRLVQRHYYSRGWRSPFDRYKDLLAEVLTPASVVLDVGCGREFPMAAWLSEHAAEVHGIDPIAPEGSAAGGAILKRGSVERLPYADRTFDVVASRAVLEHLRNPVPAFRQCRRVLKPGGRMVFLAANRYDYVSLAAMSLPKALHARIIRSLEGRDESDTFATYYQANSAHQIRRLARRTGFVVERLHYLNVFPYLLKFSPLLCRLAILYDELICRFEGLRWLKAMLLGSLRRPADAAEDEKGDGDLFHKNRVPGHEKADFAEKVPVPFFAGGPRHD